MKTVKWGLVVVALFTGISAMADQKINCLTGEDTNANIVGCVPADISKEEIADLYKNAPTVELEKESIQEQTEEEIKAEIARKKKERFVGQDEEFKDIKNELNVDSGFDKAYGEGLGLKEFAQAAPIEELSLE